MSKENSDEMSKENSDGLDVSGVIRLERAQLTTDKGKKRQINQIRRTLEDKMEYFSSNVKRCQKPLESTTNISSCSTISDISLYINNALETLEILINDKNDVVARMAKRLKDNLKETKNENVIIFNDAQKIANEWIGLAKFMSLWDRVIVSEQEDPNFFDIIKLSDGTLDGKWKKGFKKWIKKQIKKDTLPLLTPKLKNFLKDHPEFKK
jgi:hypothetical protein